MLTARVSASFDHRSRSKGHSYFGSGSVISLSISQGKIAAAVRGDEDYTVTADLVAAENAAAGRNASSVMDAARGTLLVSCACPNFQENRVACKHIYATLLAAERNGLTAFGAVPAKLNLALAKPNETVHEQDEFDDDDLDDEDDAADEDSEEDVPYSPRNSGRPGPAALAALRLIKGAESSPRNARTDSFALHPPRQPVKPAWMAALEQVRPTHHYPESPRKITPVTPMYVLDLGRTSSLDEVVLKFFERKQTKSGFAGTPKAVSLNRKDVAAMQSAEDRSICQMLLGMGNGSSSDYYYGNHGSEGASVSIVTIHKEFIREIFPRLSATGRFFSLEAGSRDPLPLVWRDGPPWELVLRVAEPPADSAKPKAGGKTGIIVAPNDLALSIEFQRGEGERLDPAKAITVLDGEPGIIVHRGAEGILVEPARLNSCKQWLTALGNSRPVPIPRADVRRLVRSLPAKNNFPRIEVPGGLGVDQLRGEKPTPVLDIEFRKAQYSDTKTPVAAMSVRYASVALDPENASPCVLSEQHDRTTMISRDLAAERSFVARLTELGFRRPKYIAEYTTSATRLPGIIATLLGEGWLVRGDKAMYRQPGKVSISVTSGIDWFNVNGSIDFDGQRAELPALLRALREDSKFVTLGDGSLGMLPDAWLRKHRGWLQLGKEDDGSVRFSGTQLGLIDALLAEMPEVTCDAQVREARARLKAFDGVRPLQEPNGFRGQLREYQREGLGWLGFLDDFRFGGCLADDMGLGKTIQALAHITRLRSSVPKTDSGANTPPSAPWLVVAPKSLVFNWAREAARFAPGLRVLDYTGVDRDRSLSDLANTDLVLTTYATMRLDIESLRKVEFDGVILDEAQSIKNHDSLAAKAARLLKARRRLAMTGTPVENHLGDLWSIFDFLNPGMLGGLPSFRAAFASRDGQAADMRLLQRALKPFILRRTKERVAPELPARVEQTVQCKLGRAQRKQYNELRDHFRASILSRVDKEGMAKSKIHILEALLRLRQAACHPGLIDKSKPDADSAKLETLLEMIDEMGRDGHKALIFSQFTSMLALVRKALDEKGVAYEYLDGATNKRQECVDRFQSVTGPPVFLISLKAGGFGLNLTSADYVFILDPWWNPAVEAQAIDRAHRIGQDKKVIAYRLIAQDTIEERIAELQTSKRQLAESIVGETESLIRTLTRDDLAALLG